MKMSEVSVDDLMEYLREDEESPLLSSILDAGKKYILNYTGRTAEELDENEEISIALLAVCADMYDKRGITSSTNLYENPVAENILESHRVNFVEGEAMQCD